MPTFGSAPQAGPGSKDPAEAGRLRRECPSDGARQDAWPGRSCRRLLQMAQALLTPGGALRPFFSSSSSSTTGVDVGGAPAGSEGPASAGPASEGPGADAGAGAGAGAGLEAGACAGHEVVCRTTAASSAELCKAPGRTLKQADRQQAAPRSPGPGQAAERAGRLGRAASRLGAHSGRLGGLAVGHRPGRGLAGLDLPQQPGKLLAGVLALCGRGQARLSAPGLRAAQPAPARSSREAPKKAVLRFRNSKVADRNL